MTDLHEHDICLYHVTFEKNKNKILKEGIFPQKQYVYRNLFGASLKDKDTIYAFSSRCDAIAWCSRMERDYKKPIVIIKFKGNLLEYERDTNHQASDSGLKKKGSVLPEEIIDVMYVTIDMIRKCIQEKEDKARKKSIFLFE